MKVAEIRTGKETFHCKLNELDVDEFTERNKDWLPKGTVFEVVEMTEDKYNSIPATQRSKEVFGK